MTHQRSIPLCIVFSIITCGIYMLYWMVVLNDEVIEVTGEPGPSGGSVLLFSIITCGIYSLFWAYKTGERLDNARARNGVPSGSFPILFLALNFFGLGIITLALAQNELNRYSAV